LPAIQATRSIGQTEATLSRASLAPTEVRLTPVGAVLARHTDNAVYRTNRGDLIAGKPRSHRSPPNPCGSGACPRYRQRGLSDKPRRPYRGQAALPQKSAYPLLERGLPAILATRSIGQTEATLSQASRAPTEVRLTPVGAVLARDTGDAVHRTNRGDLIAGKPRSHRSPPNPCGSGACTPSRQRGLSDKPRRPYRGQAALPQKSA